MAGHRSPGPNTPGRPTPESLLDVPDADALLRIARRFSATVSAAWCLYDIACKASDLPDALGYNPGDGVVKTILTLAAHAPDPEQLAGFAELLLQLKSVLQHQLARNEVISTDELTGDVTAHTTTGRTPRASLAPRPAPRPHAYVAPQEDPVTDDQLPADQTAPAPVAGEVAPADLSDEALRAERDELEAIMRDGDGSMSQGTPEQERRWKKLLFESMDRSNAELAAMNRSWEEEAEQRRQADEKAREAELKEVQEQQPAPEDQGQEAPEITALAAKELTREDLLAHRDRLLTFVGHSTRGGTAQQRQQYQIVSGELQARAKVQAQLDDERWRQTAPPGAIDHARALLLAGGLPTNLVDTYIYFSLRRGWRGLRGEELTDQYWAREIRRHKISTGELPTKTILKSRRSAAAGLRGRGKARRPERLAKKYLPIWDDIQVRLDRAIRDGREAEWRQAHPAQVVLLELPEDDLPVESSGR